MALYKAFVMMPKTSIDVIDATELDDSNPKALSRVI